MTGHELADLSVLDQFASAAFPPGYPSDRRAFFSPVDNVHGALSAVIQSAQRSLVIAMYGFDDADLADIILEKLNAEHVYVQLTLDSSQAGGVAEKKLLAKESYPASSVAIGRSERGAIIHLKDVVVDGVISVHGSTNWSGGGESLQDNELIITNNPAEAAILTARISAIHANILNKGK